MTWPLKRHFVLADWLIVDVPQRALNCLLQLSAGPETKVPLVAASALQALTGRGSRPGGSHRLPWGDA
eukprot:CAMPEP_0204365566 /NCGR_PEP_ID=MMETSP0469-20131031/42005_1 /ASSEMBLY_ACC=CAM_ASM_000384 /TAXON_ID=2969 /ORGANISM="Oxyrrhis marina" /LENGTH=67 /DNA_ID=CAMNT_0051354643 /DNA_START=179 /DNA_END=379 /DNA_ORIENTATION=+